MNRTTWGITSFLASAIAAACVIVVGNPIVLTAQQWAPELIYRERTNPGWAATTPTMFNGSGQILIDVTKRGIYVFDTLTWRARQVVEIDDMNSFEYSRFSNRTAGGVTIMQTGNAGTRIWKVDESLRVRADTLPGRIDTIPFYTHFDYCTGSTLYFYILTYRTNPPIDRKLITFDGGDTWRTFSGNFSFVENDGVGGVWTVQNGSKYLSITHPLLFRPDRSDAVQTPALGNPTTTGANLTCPPDKAFYGADTIIWIGTNRSKVLVGVGRLGDTTSTTFESLQAADGRPIGLHKSRSALYNTATRRAFLCDSTGVIYEYRRGQWHTVDTIEFFNPMRIERVYDPYHVNYPVYRSDGTSGFSLLRLTDSLEQEYRPKEYYDAEIQTRQFPMIHPDVADVRLNWSGPMVLTLKSGRGYVVSSTLRDIQDLDPVPMLCGVGGVGGQAPLIVSYCGLMIRPEASGAGRLVSAMGWGLSYNISRNFDPGPIRHSTEGLLMPSVNSTEILFPGQRLVQYDRNGKFRRVISRQQSSSALRIDSNTILIGNSTRVYRWINGSIVDSTDVLPSISSADSALPGFVTKMVPTYGNAIVGFVSGLHILDSETLTIRPSRSGGIVHSTDRGVSWRASSMPDKDPFFIGVVQVDDNVLVAGYTTLVRDTARMNIEYFEQRQNEALFTTMSDYHIVRSSDGGVTWEKVYTRSSSFGFRLIGCSGVRMADGRLLMNGPDGMLQSFDGGVTWDFHFPDFEEITDVISFFTDDDALDVYYCTSTGVFKKRLVTTTVDADYSAIPEHDKGLASTWSEHQRGWARSGHSCVELTTLKGGSLPTDTPPPPGVYFARLTDSNGQASIRRVLVIE